MLRNENYDRVTEGMPLWAFSPESFSLRAFVECEGVDNALFVCDNVNVKGFRNAITVGECVLKTHYIDIWDLVGQGKSRGCLVKLHDGVKIRYQGRYTVSVSRIVEPDVCPVTEWLGEWVRVVEGDNGVVILNNCVLSNAATKRMEIS